MLGPGPQPVGLLHRMSALERAYDAVRKLRGAVGADIHKLSDDDSAIIAYFREEGWL